MAQCLTARLRGCGFEQIRYQCDDRIKNLCLVITICHYSASLVMPNGDPRYRFFYPFLTLMIDSYIILTNWSDHLISTAPFDS